MAPVSLNDLRPWAVAVLIEGKLYLFEPALGLPIPGPGKIGRDRGGRLDIRPATLAEVAADDGLLRRLDQPRTSPYPLKAADLSRIVFLIEASPQYLAKRMQLIESRLTGKQKMALTAAPTATAHRLLAAAGGRASAQLWLLPYMSLQRRMQLGPAKILGRLITLLPFHMMQFSPLYRGRVLHLKGQLTDEPGVRPYNPETRPANGRPAAPDFSGWGATSFYQMARPSNQEMDEMMKSETERLAQESLAMIERAVQQRSLAPSQAKTLQEQAKLRAAEAARDLTEACFAGKCYASYWLGALAMEQGNYASAIDYFTNRTLAAAPTGQWSPRRAVTISPAPTKPPANGTRRSNCTRPTHPRPAPTAMPSAPAG